MLTELKRLTAFDKTRPHKRVLLELYSFVYGVTFTIEISMLATVKDVEKACRALTRKGLHGEFHTTDEWIEIFMNEVNNNG
ncbi:MAG: hypothetical protein J6S85_26650 [Methanobrevibacter sp.]|nr:hypothetical protein [Methanobrevibacter sp.]MBO7717175.1 hypothetical protein [Methanobrevibacter sp.]